MAIYRQLSALHMESTAGQVILDRMVHPVLLVDAALTLPHGLGGG